MLTSWYTAKCANVLYQAHDNIRVIGYSDPALEGSSVTLECISPHLVHMGPNITTCMENGEWEPDPREVNCIGEIVRSSLASLFLRGGGEVILVSRLDPVIILETLVLIICIL
jgi:hypothetical protein